MEKKGRTGRYASLLNPRPFTASSRRLAKIFGVRNSHSQTVITSQSNSASGVCTLQSFATLAASFFSQNSGRVLGV